jgi:hypothetical protein
MREDWQRTEALLGAAFQQQADVYAEALTLADDLLAAWQPGIDPGPVLQKIGAFMAQIASSNAAIAQQRLQWQQSGRKPEPKLQSTMQSVTQLIERLANRIRELEHRASTYKDQLIPELDNLVRARQMQRAYATAGVPRSGF